MFVMRKRFFVFLSGVFGALLLTLSGCSYSMYEDAENWAVLDSDIPVFFAEYDLIYLYPSCEEKAESGYYMNWISGNVGSELRGYVRLMISAQFGSRVRGFSPFVPMLGFDEYSAIIDEFRQNKQHDFNFYNTKLKVPIDYMVEALNAYFSHFNSDGHPFVICGHGQGALVLYEAMKRCGKVKPSKGFVVAYLFGLPGVTNEKIRSDFGCRGIKPVCRRDNLSAIAVCNTRAPGEPLEKTLAIPGGAVVNPLNWRCDATPAGRRMNPGSVFFDHKASNPIHRVKRIPRFCGATVDPDNGIVNLTELPKKSTFKIGEQYFWSDSWGIFSQSVVENARERVLMYRFSKTDVEIPD